MSTEPPMEENSVDGAPVLGEARRDPAASGSRDGADSHDVGPGASEEISVAEKGGVGAQGAHPAPDVRRKALACLRSGRVTVLGVKVDEHWRPVRVVARVRSSQDGHPYRVQLHAGTWTCGCRDGLHGEPCGHVHAVALVTAGTTVTGVAS